MGMDDRRIGEAEGGGAIRTRVGQAADIDVEILRLDGPLPRKGPLDSTAGGPPRPRGVSRRSVDRAGRERDRVGRSKISKSHTGCAEEQPIARYVTCSRADG